MLLTLHRFNSSAQLDQNTKHALSADCAAQSPPFATSRSISSGAADTHESSNPLQTGRQATEASIYWQTVADRRAKNNRKAGIVLPQRRRTTKQAKKKTIKTVRPK
jgi:hypothetical protein